MSEHRSALLVIDVQNSLFEREFPIYNADGLIENINTLIDRARADKRPVIFVQHTNGAMPVGSDGWQIRPDLHRESYDFVIQKNVGNAFEGSPSLDWVLKDKSKVDTIYVTGLVSDQCVHRTAQGGMDLGYRVFLVSDAHSSNNERAAEIVEAQNAWAAENLTGVVVTSDVQFE